MDEEEPVEYIDFNVRSQSYAILLKNVPAGVSDGEIRHTLGRFGAIDSIKTIVGNYQQDARYKVVKVTFFARYSALAAKRYLSRTKPFHADDAAPQRPFSCVMSNSTSKAAQEAKPLGYRKCVNLLNSAFPLNWSSTVEELRVAARHQKVADASEATTAKELGLYCMENSVLALLPPDVLDAPSAAVGDGEEVPTAAELTTSIWGIDNIGATGELACYKEPMQFPVKTVAKAVRRKIVPGSTPSGVVCTKSRMSLQFGTGLHKLNTVEDGGCKCGTRVTLSAEMGKYMCDGNVAGAGTCGLPTTYLPERVPVITALPKQTGAQTVPSQTSYAEDEIKMGKHVKSAISTALQRGCQGIVIRKVFTAS